MQKVFDANDTVKAKPVVRRPGQPGPGHATRAAERPGTPCRLAGRQARRYAGRRPLRQPGAARLRRLRLWRRQDGGGALGERPDGALLQDRSTSSSAKWPAASSAWPGTPIVRRQRREGPPLDLPERAGRAGEDLGRARAAVPRRVRRPAPPGQHFRAGSRASRDPLQLRRLRRPRIANAEQLNLLGAAHQIFDQAGMVRVPELDFKGNPKRVERVLARDYKNNLDWSALPRQAECRRHPGRRRSRAGDARSVHRQFAVRRAEPPDPGHAARMAP